MMSITRSVVARQAGRSIGAFAFAPLLVAVGVLLAAEPADADANSPPNVYHSPGDTGLDTRSDFPPGCVPADGGAEAAAAEGAAPASAAVAASNAVPVELITNGSFENEGLSGWTVSVNEGSFSDGRFYSATGTVTPVSGFPTAGPSAGAFYATSDQTGPTSTALWQVFTVPAGATSVALSYDMFVNDQSGSGPIVNPGYLEIVSLNQFATVDILTAAAVAGDPFTAEIVQNLYLSVDPGPNPNPYTPYAFDLTSALGGGGTFVLRFAQIDTVFFQHQGVDNVSLLVDSDGPPPTPSLDCVIKGDPGEELFLYIDGGDTETSMGTECKMDVDPLLEGNGDELCAADVEVVISGFGVFTEFIMDADPGMATLVWHPNCLPATCDAENLLCTVGECDPVSLMCTLPPGCVSPTDLPSDPPTRQIRMNFRRGVQGDIEAGERRLGKLVLDSTPDEGMPVDTLVLVSGVAGIGAKLQVRQIAAGGLAPEVIAGPFLPEPGAVAQIVSGIVGLGCLYRLRRRASRRCGR